MVKLAADIFAEHFAPLENYLARRRPNARRNGYISKAGWLIQYCFGKDETDEYMDYYTTHRMTTDSHVRIYADGQEKIPPSTPCIS